MPPLSAGALTERVTIEQPSGTAWALVAAGVFASVLPGGTAAAAPSLFPELAATAPSVAYQVKLRYRTDVTSGMRIRWGSKTLAIATVVDPDNRRHELLIQTGTVPSYTEIHAAALAAIANEGFAVTFSKDSTVGYDQLTDTLPAPASSTSTIVGYAKWIPGGKPTTNEPSVAVETASPRLLFVPTTLGQMPAPNAYLDINSTTYVLESRDDVAPDGTAIGAYLLVSR